MKKLLRLLIIGLKSKLLFVKQIAVCKANSDIDMLSISIALSGFTYDEEMTGVQNKI
ncbi:hypothetical protein RE438_28870 (plasmid) [Bacillus wiedmannii]|uniref:hypothetical protein n=1 Tax=Bacillus wiedmannii TaxID=1890302 RepID=UPI0028831282|nr:hypothetical protein [Bacillus wiedmannii]WMS85245.1 hypothetical protein RE438_28870 [Bacillus wiedmannii]